MYGIFTYKTGCFFGANVGKYSIHGAYGYICLMICFGSVLRTYFPYVPLAKVYFPLILMCLAVCLQGACRHRFPRLPNRKSPDVGDEFRSRRKEKENNHDLTILGLIYRNMYRKPWFLLHLVGGFNPSEKYWSVGIIIPNIYIYMYTYGKKCSKPPISHLFPQKIIKVWRVPLNLALNQSKANSTNITIIMSLHPNTYAIGVVGCGQVHISLG